MHESSFLFNISLRIAISMRSLLSNIWVVECMESYQGGVGYLEAGVMPLNSGGGWV